MFLLLTLNKYLPAGSFMTSAERNDGGGWGHNILGDFADGCGCCSGRGFFLTMLTK